MVPWFDWMLGSLFHRQLDQLVTFASTAYSELVIDTWLPRSIVVPEPRLISRELGVQGV